MTAQPAPDAVALPVPLASSVRVIAPLPGDAPHCSVHTADRRRPGAFPHDPSPHGTHVPCELVGTDRGLSSVPCESTTNNSINEFATGDTDAVVYDVASALLYALVSSDAPIAT
jgi:hypothetical protein